MAGRGGEEAATDRGAPYPTDRPVLEGEQGSRARWRGECNTVAPRNALRFLIRSPCASQSLIQEIERAKATSPSNPPRRRSPTRSPEHGPRVSALQQLDSPETRRKPASRRQRQRDTGGKSSLRSFLALHALRKIPRVTPSRPGGKPRGVMITVLYTYKCRTEFKTSACDDGRVQSSTYKRRAGSCSSCCKRT